MVLLSGREDKGCMHEAWALGVDGVVLSVQAPSVMVAVIEGLYTVTHDSDRVDHDGAAGRNSGAVAKPGADSATQPPVWLDVVTEREREVICLVRQGLSNREISRLCIGERIVWQHRTTVLEKLGCRIDGLS